MVNGAYSTTPRSNGRLPTNYGATGLKQTSGWLYDEWDIELQGDVGRRNIREMLDSSPVIGAGLHAFEILMRGTHRQVTPANDSAAARQVADFVDSCCDDMDESWEEFIAAHLRFLPFGWEWREIEYKLREGPQDPLDFQLAAASVGQGLGTSGPPPQPTSGFDDGKIGWHRFATRSQESLLRWEFTRDGQDLLGMWQIPAPTYQIRFVPYARSMNFRASTAKDNPEGRSILRNTRIPYKFVKRIMVHEGIGIERDLAGLPAFGLPPELMLPNPTAQDAAAFAMWQQIGQNIRNDEQGALFYPLDYDENNNPRYKVELLSSPGAKQFDTDKVIGRYEQRILLVLLADFLMIGHEGVGSRALVDPRMDLFAMAADAYLRMSASVLNTRAIPQLCALNKIDRELAPRIQFGRIRMTSLLNMAKFVLAVTQANQAGPLTADVLQRLYEAADLPTADLGATLETQQPNAPGQNGPQQPGAPGQAPPAGKIQQPGADTNTQREAPEVPETPEEKVNAAAEFPADWPDWAVHEVQDLIGQRPSSVDARTWGHAVLDSATRVMAEREMHRTTHLVGEGRPAGGRARGWGLFRRRAA